MRTCSRFDRAIDNVRLAGLIQAERIFVLGNRRWLDFANADAAIAGWLRVPQTMVIAVSPCPSQAEYASYDRLCPIATRWVSGGNVLTSPSTHTDNLVTNTDIAPTIARAFGVKLQSPGFGNAIVSPHSGILLYNSHHVTALNNDAIAQLRALRAFPYIAGALATLIVIISLAILKYRRDAVILTQIVFLVPICLLVWHPDVTALPIPIALAILFFGRRLKMLGITAVTTIWILADALLAHGQVGGASLLGYAPSEGARYYGVGNEVMGFWIGAATYACCKLDERPRGKFAAIILAVAVIAALGLPGAGAKAGGFLVGLVTLGAALWTASGRKVKPVAAVAGGVGILAVGAVALVVMGRLFGASHVTQAVGLAHRQGIGAIISVINAQGAMDAHLVFHSVWRIVLLVASVSTYVALRPIWRSPDLPRTEVVALITATTASLLLNDAGVVAAALCSITLWSSAMLLSERFRSTATKQVALGG